ncbi:OprO/OprP family phosphate-selective porin [Pontibacter sp. 13R65]|uniref:OprO/OprP family phosphate-selective porin n=1 Tax=Pontibacter sp. 13R65 TaxID=3127458 RepID=UPI00301BE692
MKQILTVLLCFFSLGAGFAQSVTLEPYWNSGLKFKSEDERYQFSVGGRVHFDYIYQQHGAHLDTIFEPIGERIQIRRARINFSGTLDDFIEYDFEFNFGETFNYGDMYIAFLRVPLLDRITIGYLREPFGMEEQTNANRLVFMERSLTNAIGTGRNVGIRLEKHHFDDKFSAYAGINRLTNNLIEDVSGEGSYSLTTRLVYSPLLQEELNRAVHLGISGGTYSPINNTYQLESQNEAEVNVMYVQTPELEQVRQVRRVAGEAGYTAGQFSMQAEYMHAFAEQVEQASKVTHDFSSYYILGSYFLSGGSRKYRRSNTNFSSIQLEERSEENKLRGAWEIGLRFSSINTSSVQPDFGVLKNLSLGLNWYFTSSSRLMLNMMRGKLQSNHTIQALQFRAQVSF